MRQKVPPDTRVHSTANVSLAFEFKMYFLVAAYSRPGTSPEAALINRRYFQESSAIEMLV